jgi:iron complex outermembrane recepter protein
MVDAHTHSNAWSSFFPHSSFPNRRRRSAGSSATSSLVCALFSIFVPTQAAFSQHAADDPVAAADDAFGLTLGLESIGLYGPGSIRGFNPQTAGNVRIDGLYFDQQGGLSNRVVEGSTIRVGISEVGYAFPAPTGIVDYDLRHVGDGTPSASVVVTDGPFEGQGLSVDGVLPIGSSQLQLPMGVSDQISMQNNGVGSSIPGYTSRIRNFGATPYWKPNDRITVRLLIDWTQIAQAKTAPLVYTAGDYEPPSVPRGYYGQNWAETQALSENFGAIVNAKLTSNWSLAAGAFRSVYDVPISFADLYLNTQRNGLADHGFVANPDQSTSSNSGEIRLTGQFGTGAVRQEVTILARGRDTLAMYGGSDFVDTGPAQLGELVVLPEPNFQFSARTRDLTRLLSAGLGYRVQWKGYGDFEVGLQHENYEKTVDVPGLPQSHLEDSPLRAYARLALSLSDRLTAYAGYTQGLEDSGTAPSGAENRGAILPDARTWQDDAGVQLKLTQKLKLIAGVFEIEKPYFNFDTDNVDRKLGLQRAEGFETSVSGELFKNLNVTAGALLGDVKIVGPNLAAEGVGPIAFGQPKIQGTFNLDYKFESLPGLSADATVVFYGRAPATVDNVVQIPPQTIVFLGGRYRFSMFGKPATLRVQLQNATNIYFWNIGYNPGFSQFQPRSIFSYLTVDI